jgi:type IV pilus assembly protein PilE
MIVVAVIVILGTVAVPSYNEYIRAVHRADARAGLLQAQQWLERAATANGTYPTELPADLTWAHDSSKRYHRLPVNQRPRRRHLHPDRHTPRLPVR